VSRTQVAYALVAGVVLLVALVLLLNAVGGPADPRGIRDLGGTITNTR
jgi:hypothetical protein